MLSKIAYVCVQQQYLLLFLVLALNSDWFLSYTLLLKLPVLMRSYRTDNNLASTCYGQMRLNYFKLQNRILML